MKTKSTGIIKEFLGYEDRVDISNVIYIFSRNFWENKIKNMIRKQKSGISVNCFHVITTFNKTMGSWIF